MCGTLPSLGVLRHLSHKPRLSAPTHDVTEGSPIAVQRFWGHGWSLRAIAQDALDLLTLLRALALCAAEHLRPR
eukprot:SAG11_NODE_17255_length_523_cov_33.264151_1_plen_74_part_00